MLRNFFFLRNQGFIHSIIPLSPQGFEAAAAEAVTPALSSSFSFEQNIWHPSFSLSPPSLFSEIAGGKKGEKSFVVNRDI